jgi:hypothetical protein
MAWRGLEKFWAYLPSLSVLRLWACAPGLERGSAARQAADRGAIDLLEETVR